MKFLYSITLPLFFVTHLFVTLQRCLGLARHLNILKSPFLKLCTLAKLFHLLNSCLFLIATLTEAHCGGTFDRGRRVCWLCCHRYRELLGSRQDATEAKCRRSAGHCGEEHFHPHTFHLD